MGRLPEALTLQLETWSYVRGDFTEALADFEAAKTIYEETGNLEKINGVRLLQSIACIQQQPEDLEVRLDKLAKAQFAVKARAPGTMGDHTARQHGTHADFVTAYS